ncbi:MAG: TVP38/TMEM64 family protein [Rubrivivax sp.]
MKPLDDAQVAALAAWRTARLSRGWRGWRGWQGRAWRWATGAVLLVCVGLWAWMAGPPVPDGLHTWAAQAETWHRTQPLALWMGFMALFAGLSALSLPGCAPLALAAGALWGPWWGSLWITLASALGAMLPFYLARRHGRERLARHYPAQLARLDLGLSRRGLGYLLLLRLVPLVPYTLVNPLMGLTSIRGLPFFVVSALGMWAGSAVYALAGTGLWHWAYAGV